MQAYGRLHRSWSLIPLILAAIVSSCNPDGLTPSSATPPLAATLDSTGNGPGSVPQELLRISGVNAPYTSSPLRIAQPSTLLIHWEQSSIGEFSLVVVQSAGLPPEMPGADLTFEFIVGPSSGLGEAQFSSGEYVVEIRSADGPWLVWIETVAAE